MIDINPILDIREHFNHITEDVRKISTTLPKRTLSPSHKTLLVEQLLRAKYHATHLGVFNERQLKTIDNILNKTMRQSIGLLSNFPTDGMQPTPKESGMGLPSDRDKVTQMGMKYLTLTINKDTERGYLAYSHTLRLFSQLNHWPMEAIESNALKLPTLHVLRQAGTIPGLELESLPKFTQENEIADTLRTASQDVDLARQHTRHTI